MSTPLRASACLLALALAASARAGQADGRLDIYWNDVEGGGATLIVTPAGQSVLIDSGNPGTRDAGRIHEVATKEAGLQEIDFFILTHFHIDHFGGIGPLAAMMPVGEVYDRGIPLHAPDEGTREAIWILTSRPYRTFRAAGRNRVVPGLTIPLKQAGALKFSLRCVASGGEFIPAPAGAPANPLAREDSHKNLHPSDNDLSSAWILDFGPFRFWDGGDLTWNQEAKLVVPVNRIGQVDVYQTDHHGLAFSNNPVLIHSLAPTISVMNNGATKGTAKPTVESLRSSPGIQAMYQLHKNTRAGDPEDNTADAFIANFSSDPNHADAHYIKLSVAPDGLSYTVSIAGSGHERTYQTRLNKG